MSFVTVATIGVSAFQQVQAGNYANGQAKLQAQQMDYQAQVENDNALKTAAIIRRAGRKQVGQANAAYAAAGVVVGAGSAGDVEQQITYDYEHDAYQALLEGHRRGRGMSTQADLTRIDGGMRQTAGYVNGVGSVLGGAYQGMRANGWRTGGGPGFSGGQAPAPVTDLSTYSPGARSL
jgi:hypothetical protein